MFFRNIVYCEKNDNKLSDKSKTEEDDTFKLKAGIFLTSVTGISALIGFGATVASAKKKDPAYFSRGMVGSREMAETGASLALRALGWGSLYAVTGCGVLFFTIWKLMDVKDLQEFRMKMGTMLPRIPRNNPPQGRTEFENLTDLLRYVSEDASAKNVPPQAGE